MRGVQVIGGVMPGVLSFGGGSVTATLTLTTGATTQTAAVGVEPSQWPDSQVQGSPLRISDQVIAGAGHQTGGYSSGDPSPEVGASSCFRGAPSYEGDGIVLTLPADSSTTVSWQISFAAAPWPAEKTSLSWAVAVPATARDSQLVTERRVGPVALRQVGVTGVHIRLRARGGVQPPGQGSLYPRVRSGSAVQITGTTQPVIPHTRVDVAEVSTTGHRTRGIAAVTTRADGSFVTTWRPQQTGTYTITSAVAHPPDGLLPDKSCDLALTVTKRPERRYSLNR